MKFAICDNCGEEIYQKGEKQDWQHVGSNNIICCYDYAMPKEGTIHFQQVLKEDKV